jgi:hypothetical protein
MCFGIRVLIYFAIGILSRLAFAEDQPRTTVASVSQVREKKISPTGLLQSSKATVTLHLESIDLKYPIGVGNLEVIEAVDDLGTDLRPSKVEENGFKDVDGARIFALRKAGSAALPIQIELIGPARGAARIVKLRGRMQIRCWESVKQLNVTNLMSQFGKAIDDDDLKEAGLSMKVTATDDNKILRVEYSGDLSKLYQTLEPQIFDNTGKPVEGSHPINNPPARKIWYTLNRKLDDSITFRPMIGTKIKTIDVSFEIGNIELP